MRLKKQLAHLRPVGRPVDLCSFFLFFLFFCWFAPAARRSSGCTMFSFFYFFYFCLFLAPEDRRSLGCTMSSSICVLFFSFFYFCYGLLFFAPAAWRSSGCTMSSSICVRIARTVRLRDMSKCFSSKGSNGFRRGDAIRSLACRCMRGEKKKKKKALALECMRLYFA